MTAGQIHHIHSTTTPTVFTLTTDTLGISVLVVCGAVRLWVYRSVVVLLSLDSPMGLVVGGG